MTTLVIDWSAAKKFCQLVTGEDDPAMLWQTFDDNKTKDAKGKIVKRPELAATRRGKLSDKQTRAWLQAQNDAGAGIYITVNECKGGIRRKESATDLRALFVDLDTPGQKQPAWALKPHIVNQTSPGKFHAYWLIDHTDVAADAWLDAQARLAGFYSSDRAMIDVVRVMRVPGFFHRKGKPVRVVNLARTDMATAQFDRYTLLDVTSAHQCDYEPPTSAAQRAADPEAPPAAGWDRPADIERARAYLAKLDPSDYAAFQDGELFKAAAMLKDLGLSPSMRFELLAELNERAAEPWTDEALWEKIRNARYTQNAAGAKATIDPADDFEDEIGPEPQPAPGKKLKKDTYTLKRAMARKPIFGWDNEADVDLVKDTLVEGWKVDKACTILADLIAAAHRCGLSPQMIYELLKATWPALYGADTPATKAMLRQIIVYYCDALHGPGEQATGKDANADGEEQSDGTWHPRWDGTRLAPLKEWQFIIDSYQFVHDDGAQFLNVKQFEMKYGKLSKSKKIVGQIERGVFPMKKWTAQVYVPMKPPTFRYVGPPTMPYEGKTVFNLWRPGRMKPKAGDHAWFVEHVAKLFPNDTVSADLLLDYMAQLVQHPDVKIHFALLLQSVEGAGKGALARILRRIVGDRNTVEPSNDEVTDKYSGWQERAQIAIINELYAAERHDVFNRLKQPLTEDKLRIHKKYGHQFDIPNYLNIFAMTNHKDAVALTKTDRRWMVLFSKLAPTSADDPYYATLFANIASDDKIAAVMAYLLDRKIKLNPKAHAPGTEAKVEMQERMRSDSIVDLQRLLDEGLEPFTFPVVRFEEVVDHLKALNKYDAKAGINVNKFFDYIGAVRLRRYKKGGKDIPAVQLWAVKDQDKWNRMSPKDVALAYHQHGAARRAALSGAEDFEG